MIIIDRVLSDRKYFIIPGGAQRGQRAFIDRPFVLDRLPEGWDGATILQTANDDKTRAEWNFLTLQVTAPAIVAIAYDPRITPKPVWLTDWARTDQVVALSEHAQPFVLYQRTVPVGTLTVGGNSSPGGGTHYVMLVKRADKPVPPPPPPPPPPPANGPWVIVRNERGYLELDNAEEDMLLTVRINTRATAPSEEGGA